mmetsp:Transcript_39826/g.158397  ORF Transcript_39826/g.158397 Transcript_39826/m.158397 type:complete len:86 (+) Transcript_39826:1239-1496(+)
MLAQETQHLHVADFGCIQQSTLLNVGVVSRYLGVAREKTKIQRPRRIYTTLQPDFSSELVSVQDRRKQNSVSYPKQSMAIRSAPR